MELEELLAQTARDGYTDICSLVIHSIAHTIREKGGQHKDFAGTYETWRRVLTQPGEPVFLEEKNRPQATLQTALIWMLIAGVVAAIFGFLQSLTGVSSVDAMLDQADLPPEVAAQMAPLLGAAVGGAGIAAIITVPVFFLIGSFIYHLLATMLGGQGDYGKFA